MSAAQVTAAHRRLVRRISWAGISDEQVEEKAQLVADDEAGALDTMRKERDMWKANHDNMVKLKGIIASRPDLGDRAPRVSALIAERDAALAKLHALRLVCGTDAANKFETSCDRAIARAEEAESAQLDSLASCEIAVARAERADTKLANANARAAEWSRIVDDRNARLAELETANRELLHAMKVIAGMWIAETTPLAPPDALAERMAKLALAATLRKHP